MARMRRAAIDTAHRLRSPREGRTTRAASARTLAALLLAVGSLVACAGGGEGGPGAPGEGNWLGDRVYFRVEGGAVIDVRPLDVKCTGEQAGLPCAAQFGALLDGALPIVDAAFGGTLGEISIEGRFTGADRADGTLVYTSADGCCSATYDWTADYRPPRFPDVLSDAGGSGDADDGDAPAPPVDTGAPPSDRTPEQQAALRLTNEWREALNLPALRGTPAIFRAAQAHAEYYVANCDLLRAGGLSSHEESPDHDGFTGVTFVDRMRAQGWSGQGGWEVMAFLADPAEALDAWLQTLYHRIPFVHPNTVEMGYGAARGPGAHCGNGAADVIDFGRGGATTRDAVRFPPDGFATVPRSWDGLENPQPPLPAGESYPSGPMITLTWPEGGAIVVATHRLAAEDGVDVPHVLRTPADDPYLAETVALYARDPLEPETTYTVTIEGTRGGAAFSEVWRFTTAR